MSRRNKLLIALFIVSIAIQFIQPVRNINRQALSGDISKLYVLPDQVSAIFKNSCYDCHSNSTRYPWYSFIQPGAWIMASHIRKGKAKLNFSEFGALSNRKQRSKLQEMANSIKDETMPLWSYTLIHQNAKLSPDEKTLLLNWMISTKDSLALRN